MPKPQIFRKINTVRSQATFLRLKSETLASIHVFGFFFLFCQLPEKPPYGDRIWVGKWLTPNTGSSTRSPTLEALAPRSTPLPPPRKEATSLIPSWSETGDYEALFKSTLAWDTSGWPRAQRTTGLGRPYSPGRSLTPATPIPARAGLGRAAMLLERGPSRPRPRAHRGQGRRLGSERRAGEDRKPVGPAPTLCWSGHRRKGRHRRRNCRFGGAGVRWKRNRSHGRIRAGVLSRGQHTQRGQAGGSPRQLAGEPRHHVLRTGVRAKAAAHSTPSVPLSPAAPPRRVWAPARARRGHVRGPRPRRAGAGGRSGGGLRTIPTAFLQLGEQGQREAMGGGCSVIVTSEV